MKKVQIYTDGACLGNPGPGGWAAILEYNGKTKELSGGEAATTNNRMELMAAIAGLEALTERCAVTLTTDSRYVADGMGKGWAVSWRRNGWKKADKADALNPDLWQRLLDAAARHDVRFVWVRGHAGHAMNERCDALATGQAAALRGGEPPAGGN